LAETSEDKKTDEIPAEDAAKVKPEQVDSEATQSSTDEPSNVEAVPVEKTDNSDSDAESSKRDDDSSRRDDESSRKDDEPSRRDDEPSRRDDRQESRDGRRGGYRHERGARGEMSFEEKMRAFKKQSDERLHHIKRSREAKIGKKRTR
jgi:hypothetical protein